MSLRWSPTKRFYFVSGGGTNVVLWHSEIPLVGTSYTVSAESGSFTKDGKDNLLIIEGSSSETFGTFAETGSELTISIQRKSLNSLDEFTLQGSPTSLPLHTRLIPENLGTYSFNGQDSLGTSNIFSFGSPGTLIFSGNNQIFKIHALSPSFLDSGGGESSASYSLTGSVADLYLKVQLARKRFSVVSSGGGFPVQIWFSAKPQDGLSYLLLTDVGTFNATGNSLILRSSVEVAEESLNGFSLHGQDSHLISYTSSGEANYGNFQIHGQAITLGAHITSSSNPGLYLISTDQGSVFISGRVLEVFHGLYETIGQEDLFKSEIIVSNNLGVFTFLGKSSDLRRRLLVDSGNFSIVGESSSSLITQSTLFPQSTLYNVVGHKIRLYGLLVQVKDLSRFDRFILEGTEVDIPCIKVSFNIVETNDGVESISCYIMEDTTVFVAGLTPENDPFFYQDTEKRIFGELLVSLA